MDKADLKKLVSGLPKGSVIKTARDSYLVLSEADKDYFTFYTASFMSSTTKTRDEVVDMLSGNRALEISLSEFKKLN